MLEYIQVRYYLDNDTGAPVQPVLKYSFTYLGKAGKDYEQVNIDDLAGFLAWLKNPDILKKVVALRFESKHQPQTINAMVDTVVMFYDYLLRNADWGSPLPLA